MNITRCPCKGSNLDKLIQPAILTILAQEDLNGYKIVQRLSETPMFKGCKPDKAGVYRFLKIMERRGLVVSKWSISDTGPAKRVYKLTNTGKDCLSYWIKTLKEYHNTIGLLLELCEKNSHNSADHLK